MQEHTTDPIENWLDAHGDYLFSYAMSRVQYERELARDLVQETLLGGLKSLSGFAGKSSVRTWLTSILKNKIVDHIRQQVRHRQVFDEHIELDSFNAEGQWQHQPQAWQNDPAQLYENTAFMQTMQQCMSHLPEIQQQVFKLRELHGESANTICKDLDISSSNLYVLMHRARLALRQCLEQHWFGKRSP